MAEAQAVTESNVAPGVPHTRAAGLCAAAESVIDLTGTGGYPVPLGWTMGTVLPRGSRPPARPCCPDEPTSELLEATMIGPTPKRKPVAGPALDAASGSVVALGLLVESRRWPRRDDGRFRAISPIATARQFPACLEPDG